MTATYFGVNREGGAQIVSLVQGVDAVSVAASTQVAFDIELRVNTVDANGATPTKQDVITALDKIEAWIADAQLVTFPPL